MKVTTEQAPDSQVILTVEVDEERLEKALQQAYRRVVKEVNIPGFRRGKAPRSIVERYVGRGTLLREAIDPLLEEVYKETVRAEDLHPIASPEAEMVEVEPLTFKFTVSVRPTITLSDYHTLRFPLREATAEEPQVDEALERVRRDHATWAVVERPAWIGDQLLMDVAGGVQRHFANDVARALDGVPDSPQIDQENLEVLLTDPKEGEILGPGVIEALIGVETGQTRTVAVRYPDDYDDKELAGRAATYHITVQAVREQQLPPLDDNLAAMVGEYENLAALRDRIRVLLLAEAQAQARLEVENQMADALMAGATLETPAALIEHELDDMAADFEGRLKQQGFTLDRYLEMSKKTADEMRAGWRDAARERVRRALVFGAFARAEGLDTTDAEVDAEIERIVSEQGDAADRVRAFLSKPEQREGVENRLLSRKIADRLFAIATGAVEPAADMEPTATDESPADS